MLTKTNIGTDENGNPRWHYHSDGHVVFTGPITGTVTTADGTTYDVTEPVIEVEPEHAGEVCHHIAVRHEDEGHPDHRPTLADPDPEPFRHLCTDHCGALKRPDSHPAQAAALERAQLANAGLPDETHRADHARRLGLGEPK